MNSRKLERIIQGSVVAVIGAIPFLANCSSALCCTDYSPGKDMSAVDFGVDASIKGEFVALAQASGDLSAVANGALVDTEGACTAIATDLGVTSADIDAATAGKTGGARVAAICGLAKGKLPSGITVTVSPITCSASVKAKASCQGGCTVDGKCDIKVNPPKCTGGTLQISCKGECKVEGSAKISCEGECGGSCEGSCTATAGATVECKGKCEGTCQGSTDSGGNCNGQCKGTCKMSGGATVSCSGTCSGKCDASCKASGGVSAKCSGKCDADYEPISCEGGKLEGGCQVSANCEASCQASAEAKAECTPPELVIDAGANGAAAVATLQRNLPVILTVIKARGEAFVKTGSALVTAAGNVSASGKLGVKGIACAARILEDVTAATGNMTSALSASATLTGGVTLN